MAHQSHHDVVTQSQSADVPTSVDASAANTTDSAARAAVEKSSANATETPVLRPEPKSDDQEDGESSHTASLVAAGQESTGSKDSETKTNGVLETTEARDGDVFEESLAKSAGIEASVGSDTEISKVEAAALVTKDSESGDIIPRYAAKKSASFKPVSVTKNFLAKAGSTTTPAKPGSGNDKANAASGSTTGSAAQIMAVRPRLVAKSVSGQRGAAPKMIDMTTKVGKATGPDPNQVWNKNRVSTPQATPKHLTDEELRLQYGIQLASRPQEDGDGKEAKWADIDDDEDDWAPETIEWNDGTKVNLAEVEKEAAAAEELAAQKAKEAEERELEAQKSKEPVSKATVVGPNATVLKLGSSVQQKAQVAGAKNNSEKPTLVAKPFTPAAVKSPWAALPAVDKVSPIQINPQVQPTPSRFGQRDPHGFDAMPPPSHQAKEIAADDFSRSSRDSPNGVPRELFIPQSGRYEPVNESRRQSMRKDGNFRPPSLLQRPSPSDSSGPAEPSAAFQTHRSQQDSVSWTRRRASSTVSGESGTVGRRMSINRGLDSPRPGGEVRTRRDSQYEQSNAAPSMISTIGSQRDASPAQSHGHSIASPSPTASFPPESKLNSALHATVQQAPNNGEQQSAGSSAPQEDPVTMQKRLMREKREAAIKRKLEEEAKEDAEKRERIRLKMEMLGLTDEKMGKKAQAEQDQSAPKQLLKDTKEGKPLIPESPPKPPVPNATGPPQQYGLMKVHASQPATTVTPAPLPSIEKSAVQLPSEKPAVQLPLEKEQIVQKQTEIRPPLVNGEAKKPSGENESESDGIAKQDGAAKDASAEGRQWSSLHQQAPNSYQNWGASSMTTHSTPGGNLWGPPSNHRALGNGDFQQNLQRNSLRPTQPPFAQHLTSTTPQPIGTPRQYQQAHGTPSHSKSELLARSLIEDSQTIPAFPSPEPDPLPVGSQLRREQPMTSQANDHPHTQTSAPINKMPEPSVLEQPQTGIAAWASFGANVQRQEAEKAAQENANRMAAQQLGIPSSPQLPVLNETWKQVKRSEATGARHLVSTVRAQNNYAPALPPQTSTADLSKAISAPNATPHVRSRYQDIFEQSKRAVSVPPAMLRPQSPSGPPPDSLDHPAYNAVSQRPLVNLPGSKPKVQDKPIVKLPPVKPSAELQRPSTAGESRHVPSNRAVSQPQASNSSWQDRINGLFDRERRTSPEKRFASVVDFSASKEPLELNTMGGAKPVTLPPLVSNRFRAKELPLKHVEDEDALFEERDFGSVPTTRIPAMAPVSAWSPAKEPVHLIKRTKILAFKDTDILSVPEILDVHEDQIRLNGHKIAILLQGMTTPTLKSMFREAGHTATRGSKQQPPRFKHRPTHNKPREGPSQHGPNLGQGGIGRNAAAAPGNSAKPKPSQGGGGGNSSWARKTSGVTA